MTVQALLLDLDGTLSDGSGFDSAVFLTCRDISSSWRGLDHTRLYEANRRVWPEYWKQVEDAWTVGQLDGRTVGTEAWRQTLLRCGCEDIAVAIWAQERHWHHVRSTLRLFDDVAATLQVLGARLPLALVTNGASDTQRQALHGLGIEGRFAAVFISGERGIAKPDPAVFAHVLAELGIPAEHAWHVGDSLQTDVAGAKAAGITGVWLNREGRIREKSGPTPDHEIRSLADLPALLEKELSPPR